MRELVQEVLSDVCHPAVSPGDGSPGLLSVLAAFLTAGETALGPPESFHGPLERLRRFDLLDCAVWMGNGGKGLEAEVDAKHTLSGLVRVLTGVQLHSDTGKPATGLLLDATLTDNLAWPSERFLGLDRATGLAGKQETLAVQLHRTGAIVGSEGQGAVASVESRTAVLTSVVTLDGVYRINHPAFNGVLAQGLEPRMKLKLGAVDLRAQLHSLEAEPGQPLAFLPPKRHQVVPSDPGSVAVGPEGFDLGGGRFECYDLADQHGLTYQAQLLGSFQNLFLTAVG